MAWSSCLHPQRNARRGVGAGAAIRGPQGRPSSPSWPAADILTIRAWPAVWARRRSGKLRGFAAGGPAICGGRPSDSFFRARRRLGALSGYLAGGTGEPKRLWARMARPALRSAARLGGCKQEPSMSDPSSESWTTMGYAGGGCDPAGLWTSRDRASVVHWCQRCGRKSGSKDMRRRSRSLRDAAGGRGRVVFLRGAGGTSALAATCEVRRPSAKRGREFAIRLAMARCSRRCGLAGADRGLVRVAMGAGLRGAATWGQHGGCELACDPMGLAASSVPSDAGWGARAAVFGPRFGAERFLGLVD